MPIAVDGGSSALRQETGGIVPNFAYVTVTICVPGSTSNCQAIDHVQIDTQSVGLRIMGSVVSSTLLSALRQASTGGGQPVFECAPFADGYSWGPVTSVDIQFTSSERTGSVPIHIIEDPTSANIPAVPNDCVNSAGTNFAENSPATFGANGLLGVGTLLQDCGSECASGTVPGSYYACTSATSSGSCADITMSVSAQVQNPVAVLSGQDTNGVIMQLPAVGASGAATLSGTFYFGVGTETNNALGSATVFAVDSETGEFIGTQYANMELDESVLDAGSNAYYFNTPNIGNTDYIAQCTSSELEGYYCPTTTASQTATLQGETLVGNYTGVEESTSFEIGNAQTLLDSNLAVLPTLGATGTSGTFDWGLPFFFGKTFFVVFAQHSATGSSQQGPYMAF
jgi:hypothetical protein